MPSMAKPNLAFAACYVDFKTQMSCEKKDNISTRNGKNNNFFVISLRYLGLGIARNKRNKSKIMATVRDTHLSRKLDTEIGSNGSTEG